MSRTIVALLLVFGLAILPVMGGEERNIEKTSGEVTAVDAGNGAFTVKPDPEGAQDLTLHIDEHTKIVRDGEQTDLDDLSAGDRVTVNYTRDEGGRLVALSIGIG